MKHLLLAAVLLAGCQSASVDKAVVAGQLFCATATTAGPLVVALADASGVPVTVTGKSADVVAKACAVIGAIPVTPPPAPAQAPVVAAPIAPASVTR